MSKAHKFGNSPIACHAFNGKLTELALSANTNEVHVYRVVSGAGGSTVRFEAEDVLSEHTSLVTGIDWAAKTDRLVTCAADRNAYVWTRQADNKWMPTLVILQIGRAATCVSWSPLETKFAVGSGARTIAVCYFEQEQDWWVSKHIKKPIHSTVTSLDWHPNNCLLACGSTDFRARVFSAYIKTVDEKPMETPWGKKMTFQNLMFESSTDGWVHSVCFSADGTKLAWVGHDSSLAIADASNQSAGGPHVTTLRHVFLPFTTLTWLGPSSVLCAGHDCSPMLFRYKGAGDLTFADKVEVKSETKTGKVSAMKKFQDIDRKATSDDKSSTLNTIHQSTINELRIHKGDKTRVDQVSTVGRDGQLVLWDLRTIEQRIQSLKIA